MEEFSRLLSIARQLLGPDGCPWDREQTLYSLQPYLLEETHELIEAIDDLDGTKIQEELGDLFYALVFVALLGEKDLLFTLTDALKGVGDKLIRRHPHVFGTLSAKTTEEIINNWEQIKKGEFTDRKSALDGIPPTLPIMARAQKVIRKIKRAKKGERKGELPTEAELGHKLWELLEIAEEKGISSEDLLRRICKEKEGAFRLEEKTPEMDS